MKGLGKFFRRILLGINFLFLVILISGHFLIPNYPPGIHWPLGLIGLAYPFLVLIILCFLIFWLFFHYKYIIWNILALLICWSSISIIFAFHPHKNHLSENTSSIKIMSYNVHYFKDFTLSKAENENLRNKIIDLIEKQGPDILCMQEFYTSENPNDFNNKSLIIKKLRLPYRYFSSDHNYKNNHSGVIVFSRFPIVHAGKIDLLGGNSKEIAIYADIKKGKDTLRIFTTHLRSIYLTDRDMRHIEAIKKQQKDSTTFKATRKIVGKLRHAFKKRGKEVRILSQKIKNSPYPVIVCGDFNDPPNSYTYAHLSKGLQDAFLKKGFGLGRTFREISPTLRIDYILLSEKFKIRSYQTIHKDFSDHYPIVSEVEIQ